MDTRFPHGWTLRSVPCGQSCSSVVFKPTTCLIVAASSLQAKFSSFNEDQEQYMGTLDSKLKVLVKQCRALLSSSALNVSDPTCDCSTLELIAPDSWMTMGGYFSQVEQVLSY